MYFPNEYTTDALMKPKAVYTPAKPLKKTESVKNNDTVANGAPTLPTFAASEEDMEASTSGGAATLPIAEQKKSVSSHGSMASLRSSKPHRSSTPGASSEGGGSGGDAPTRKTTRSQLSIQENNEEPRTSSPLKHRIIHPAEQKRRQQHSRFLIPDPMESNYRKGPNSFNTLRRLSRADFSSFRKAGRKMRSIKYGEIFDQFSRYTTIHGISHAALAKSNRWKRFWYAVFLVCFLILTIQIFYLILKYFKYPKSVDLDLKFENAPFPSVTICNLNPYKASVIGKDKSVKSTMDAFKNIIETTGRSEGIAAAIAATSEKRRRRQLKRQKQNNSIDVNLSNPTEMSSTIPTMKSTSKTSLNSHRRYLQVYAQCYCEINRLSGERKRGSCFAAYRGKISLVFDDNRQLHNFHPTKCLCQLDWITKTVWPCFPYNTWKEHVCVECNDQLGHCPMRFHPNAKGIENLPDSFDICLCHKDYNHCVQNNENDEIPDIIPNFNLEQMNFTSNFVIPSEKSLLLKQLKTAQVVTTTEAPEIKQAMGFEELKDEIAINAKARENLMFAVEEKPMTERIQLSQPKDELILKCSFNQHDCNIKKDFKLYYDPTYGNCYTFNWNRTQRVTAHRAGANYGLRVLLYANVSEYLPTTEAVGFRITIHDKWTVPFPDAFGHTAPTGFMSSFGVRMKQFIRIEPPHGRCKRGGEEAETYIYKDFHYSIEGCHRSCTQNEIVRTCGCADPMFPLPDDAKHCKVSDPVARECIKNTSTLLGKLIANGELENCNCHQPCQETAYEISYSPARWPSGTTKLMECEIGDDLCIEKYQKNAAMIQVFYEELNYETLIESPAYTFSSLLADLGGVSGLWIGISVVSVVEVVQLLNYCLKAYFKRRKISSSASIKIQQQPRPYFKRSSTSSSNQLYRPKSRSIPSITKSSVRSLALEEPIDEVTPDKENEEEKRSSHESTPQRKYTYPYLPPGAELPCTCLYGSRGNIVFMKPLCPFHGYMVRRNTLYMEQTDDEDPIGDDFDNQEQNVTEEETNALSSEFERTDSITKKKQMRKKSRQKRNSNESDKRSSN